MKKIKNCFAGKWAKVAKCNQLTLLAIKGLTKCYYFAERLIVRHEASSVFTAFRLLFDRMINTVYIIGRHTISADMHVRLTIHLGEAN